ncbi:restriction endonuclease subunit S [Providencia stuartii]|nr:restriction endonuclease subunit S [Providencia stuartii]
MSEWQNVKLGEIVTLHYGKALRAQDRIEGDIPVYSSAGITGYHNVPLVMSKGIIIGRKGTVGKVYYSEKPFCCIDTAYYILPNESKYDFIWLYYQLGTIGLEELNEDSAVPGLNRETAYSQEILLPTISEQKAIASILLSLDNKIHLLHRQNKILEDMAETLFRQWFIEEAEDDWEDVELGELFSICSGKGLKRNEIVDSGLYPVLGANGEIGRCNHAMFSERLIYTGRVGTLGKIFVINENEKVWLSDNTLIFRDIKYYYFVYFQLKSIDFNEYNVGSTQPLIRQSDIKKILVNIPHQLKKIDDFERYSEVIFNKKNFNIQKIQTLEKLRDTLLPKLMSGEVRVKYTPEAEQ